MLINKKGEIHCFWCNKDFWMTNIYLNLEYEGSLSCPENHLVGNQSDPEWKKLIGEEDD